MHIVAAFNLFLLGF